MSRFLTDGTLFLLIFGEDGDKVVRDRFVELSEQTNMTQHGYISVMR